MAHRAKSRVLTKVVGTIFEIESFEQQCVIIKNLLQSEQLKIHMANIGIDKSLMNSALYEHICLENMKRLYKSDGRYYYQPQYKSLMQSVMVSPPEYSNEN